MRTDIYDVINGRILQLMESAQKLEFSLPWIKLGFDGKLAHNVTSGNAYQGINQMLCAITLIFEGFPLNRWLTFLQIQERGGRVIKGAHATDIVYVDVMLKTEDGQSMKHATYEELSQQDKEKVRKINFLKSYKVFNVAQTEGLPLEFYHHPQLEGMSEPERNAAAEDLIKATGAEILHSAQNQAYYNSNDDVILLPAREQFNEGLPYYNTVLHELAHWTGHPDRLARIKQGETREQYAFEELVAELTAAYLCAHLGFELKITNNAAYLKNWIAILKNDNRAFMNASSEAQKAVEFILKASNSERLAA